jgi:thioesterase domain-containing protein/acyl carrier protein
MSHGFKESMSSDTSALATTDTDELPTFPASPDRAAIEARIVAIFRDIFQNESVGAEDNFFGLGGDSLMADSLILGILEAFDVGLPVSIVLEAPTPQLLAEKVVGANTGEEATCLIPLRSEGAGPPIFCVHGMDGEPTFAQRLAEHINPARRIYAVRAVGLLPGEIPFGSVVEMAAAYLDEIKVVQPKGPYLILGQCGAVVVAHELAQQLVAGGDEVAGLILADPMVVDLPWLTHTGMNLAMQKAQVIFKARQSGEGMSDVKLAGKARRKQLHNFMYGVVAAYKPAPFNGPVLMGHIPAHRQVLLDPTNGYKALLPNMKSVEIPGVHHDVFDAQAGTFAAAIEEFLDSVAPIES